MNGRIRGKLRKYYGLVKNKAFEIGFKENIVKNLLILVIVFLSYNLLFSSLSSLDAVQISDFLLIVSMLLVTACFANFAFSYEYSDITNVWSRILCHVSTFIFMLLIAMLLEAIVIGTSIVYPGLFTMILIFSVLLYTGVAFYDFWDFFRILKSREIDIVVNNSK